MISEWSQSEDARRLVRLVGRTPATIEAVSDVAKLYGGFLHGDTATEIDVEFPDIASALAFFVNDAWGWEMEMRDGFHADNLSQALNEPVVVTIRKD